MHAVRFAHLDVSDLQRPQYRRAVSARRLRPAEVRDAPQRDSEHSGHVDLDVRAADVVAGDGVGARRRREQGQAGYEGILGSSKFWLLVTAILGTTFLGFQAFEFTSFVHEGLTIRTNLFGSSFFTLTGFHGAHVTAGAPDGKTLAIDNPELIEHLRTGVDDKHELTLLRSEKAMTDCRPLSIFSLQTLSQLGEETGIALDKRRFRANVYLDLASSKGFAENEFIGRSVRIGPKVVVSIIERDPRCMMITLDPDTAEKIPEILKQVAQAHEGMAGVYGAVLSEGMIRKGDSVELLN